MKTLVVVISRACIVGTNSGERSFIVIKIVPSRLRADK